MGLKGFRKACHPPEPAALMMSVCVTAYWGSGGQWEDTKNSTLTSMSSLLAWS